MAFSSVLRCSGVRLIDSPPVFAEHHDLGPCLQGLSVPLPRRCSVESHRYGGACPRKGARGYFAQCLGCLLNRRGRTRNPAHGYCVAGGGRRPHLLPYYLLREGDLAMKRESQIRQKVKGKFTPPVDPFMEGLPLLAEGVADHLWEDGTPREPWTLSCNWSGPMPTVQLNDKEEGRSCASTAPTVREAMEALEALLGRGALPWRYWQQKGKRKG